MIFCSGRDAARARSPSSRRAWVEIMTGKKQTDLAEVLGMSSKQAMSNKVRMNRWSADDLIKAAELCGGKVAIIMPDGQTIQLRNDEDEKSPDA